MNQLQEILAAKRKKALTDLQQAQEEQVSLLMLLATYIYMCRYTWKDRKVIFINLTFFLNRQTVIICRLHLLWTWMSARIM